MQASLTKGLTRPRCNFVKTQRVFSRAQSTVSKTKPTTASVEPKLETVLTWPSYLAIRHSKRKWQMAAMIPCALLGFVGGAAYFGNLDVDPMKPIMGIDPFFFYGVCTVGCVGAGAIIGPTIGTSLWRLQYRRLLPLIDAKDHLFFQRIAKNRVDATLQSPTNPVPDYYGEKIGSLHEYRTWLRDQAKYKRKALLPEAL